MEKRKTRTEIQHILEQLKMNPSTFSQEFSIPKRTLAHWICGDREPPIWYIDLLKKYIALMEEDI